MWEPQLALASGGWRVIAPHLRGMDAPAGEAAAQSMDDYAADVIDLLDALRIEDAVIGGLSMGGYVTFAVFRHAPQYFRGMILADTRPEADTPEGLEARRAMLELVLTQGPAAVADQMMPKLLGQTTRDRRPEVVARVRELILSSPAGAIAGAVSAMMGRPDSTSLLSSVRCPTVIVVGEEDAITPPAMSQAMQQKIPGAELVIVPSAGHLSSLEQPGPFNAALESFLKQRV